MRILFFGAVLTIALAGLSACQECLDCGPVADEPFIQLSYTPTAWLAELNSGINTTQSLATAVQTELDTLAGKTDSASVAQSDSLTLLADSLTGAEDSLQNIKDLLNSQGLRLASIKAVGTGETIVSTDTAQIFNLPLNPTADSSGFVLEVFGYDRRDSIIIGYSLSEEYNNGFFQPRADSVYLIFASDTTNTSITCASSICQSNEALLTIVIKD